MCEDITLNTFIISLDVVHSCFSQQEFIDYLKSNYKKDICIINAADFADSSGRASRNDNRSSAKTKGDGSHGIAKGIKTKIDSETQKYLDSKKRHIIQAEKAKQKIEKSPAKSARRPSKSSSDPLQPKLLYNGKTEIVFCIINYPYVHKQLTALLKAGIPLSAIISLYNNSQEFPEKPPSIQSGRQASKKTAIVGCELDSIMNPGVNPPPRWAQLISQAPPEIIFDTIDVPDSLEETWNVFEQEIGRIISCREEFETNFSDRSFVDIPISHIIPDLTVFEESIQSNNSVVDSIFDQLHSCEWQAVPPKPPKSLSEIYSDMFEDAIFSATRPFVSSPQAFDRHFSLTKSTIAPNVLDLIYPVLHWEIKQETAPITKAVSSFYSKGANFYAAAGHRFDSMVLGLNKKNAFGLPPSFYDWSKWTHGMEIDNVFQAISMIRNNSLVIESNFEESVGILWLLVLPPVTRIHGQPVKEFYMPPMLDGATNWMNSLFEKEWTNEKKGTRKPTNPLKEANTDKLLPNLRNRLVQDNKGVVYKMPSDISDTEKFIMPYYFKSGVNVNIYRCLMNKNFDFSYRINFPLDLKVDGVGDNVNVMANSEEIIMTLIGGFSFICQLFSIYFDGQKVVFKAPGETPYIIDLDGNLILEEANGKQSILTASGQYGKFNGTEWAWASPNGTITKETIEGKKNEKQVTMSLGDLTNHLTRIIREDGLIFTLTDDNCRLIKITDQIFQKKSPLSIQIKLPNSPQFHIANSEIKFEDGDFVISLTAERVTIKSPHFNIDTNFKEANLIADGNEFVLKADSVQAHSGDRYFYGDAKGTERFGTIAPPDMPMKKKMEVVQTKWGIILPEKEIHSEEEQNALSKIFSPIFLAVRPDLSGIEFLPDCNLNIENYTCKKGTIKDLSSETDAYISLHHPDEFTTIYREFQPIDKVQRSSILKELKIPKPGSKLRLKKGEQPPDPETIFEEAKNEHSKWLERVKNIRQTLVAVAQTNERDFRESITPPPPPPPDVLFQPPQQLPPRMLKMAAQNQPNECTSYWDSPECLFAMPEVPNDVLPKPIERHVNLHDPPADRPLIRPSEVPVIDPLESELAAPKTARVTTRMYKTEVSRPATSSDYSRPQSSSESINFGKVKVGSVVTQTIQVSNTGRRPLHFGIIQPSNPCVIVTTLPGTIMVGLKLGITVQLSAKKVGEVRTCFSITTPVGPVVYPICATIVEDQ